MYVVATRAFSINGSEPADPVADLSTRNEAIFPRHEPAHYVDEMYPHRPGRRFQGVGDERPEDKVQVSEK